MRVQGLGCCEVLCPIVLLQLKNGGVAKVKGEGEKEKECTTECKSRRRRDEKAPSDYHCTSAVWDTAGIQVHNRRASPSHGTYTDRNSQEFSTYH